MPPGHPHATDTTPKDTTMKLIQRMNRAAVLTQASRADTAEAKCLELEMALDALTRAVGTCKQASVPNANAVRSAYINGHALVVRAPHDQDPRVQSALTEARRVLGRAL